MTISRDDEPLAHQDLIPKFELDSRPRNALVELPESFARSDASSGWIVDESKRHPTLKCYKAGSPHCLPLEGVVLHYTASMETAGAVRTLVETSVSTGSAHFVVGRDGEVLQLVSIHDRAWHAGNGSFGTQANANACTIGIEIVNAGYLDRQLDGTWKTWYGAKVNPADVVESSQSLLSEAAKVERLSSDDRKRKGWHAFPQAQIDAVDGLLTQLAEAGIPMVLTGHQDIAAKSDPGPAFAKAWVQILSSSRTKRP